MRRVLLAICVAAMVATTGTAQAGVLSCVWDVQADFSITNGNPNGVWTYGMVAPTFQAYTTTIDTGVMRGWVGDLSSDHAPLVIFNYGPDAPQYGVLHNQLVLHPGPQGQMSVVRWTAPTGIGSSVAVQGRFFAGDGGWMQIGIFKDGNWAAPLWPPAGSGIADSGLFDFTVPISAGQTIDFGVYGGYFGGSTPLEARITGTVVPEPSAAARWLSLAAVGAVVAWRWRRRTAA